MPLIILFTFCIYVLAIFFITRFSTSRQANNDTFFLAGRATPWWVVAIGMIGDTISGVSFVSVPGMVRLADMSYLQLCIGFFLGYIIVSYVLLPLYYRLGVISIYEYLGQRFGAVSYKTGAVFFLISKMFGAAAKLYLISLILQTLVFDYFSVPYPLTVLLLVGLIWLYTQGGGMGTIIWTDILQTIALFIALVLICVQIAINLDLSNVGDLFSTVANNPHYHIFFWEDWLAPNHIVKQLLSGAFIVVVMTGLDQNMMQKNLTCKSLKDAQKNMLTYGFSFIPLNYLFLVLGILLLIYAERQGIQLPTKGDEILPYLASNYLGKIVVVCFTLGITATSFSNADSALTSLTTSVCVDLLNMREDTAKTTKWRSWIHLGVAIIFALLILLIGGMQQSSVLDTIFTAVSYTYGPLLGLYAFGLISQAKIKDRYSPIVCIISPFLSHLISMLLLNCGYKTGYELLLLNGLLTMLGLWLIRERNTIVKI